jgi:hypothetical protein
VTHGNPRHELPQLQQLEQAHGTIRAGMARGIHVFSIEFQTISEQTNTTGLNARYGGIRKPPSSRLSCDFLKFLGPVGEPLGALMARRRKSGASFVQVWHKFSHTCGTADLQVFRKHGARRVRTSLAQVWAHLPKAVNHLLLCAWNALDVRAIEDLCIRAMSTQPLPKKHDLFVPREEASSAYLIVQGQCTYKQYPASSKVVRLTSTQVDVGKWSTEAAWWVEWHHTGKMVADTACQILAVSTSG